MPHEVAAIAGFAGVADLAGAVSRRVDSATSPSSKIESVIARTIRQSKTERRGGSARRAVARRRERA